MREHVHDFLRRSVLEYDPVERRREGKIKDRCHSGIDPVLLRPSSRKKRGNVRVRMEHFSYRRKLRVGSPNFSMKLRPEAPAHVWESVQPVAVNARLFRPPERILDEVLRHVRIFLIHVRKDPGEPAFDNVAPEPRRRVWVGKELEVSAKGWVLLPRSVEPVRFGW